MHLSAATSHDSIERCDLLEGQEENQKLSIGIQISKNEMYFDFINEYPDYGPKSKMTISRQRFYKWLYAYCVYKTGVPPIEGKDMLGRWFMMEEKDESEEESEYEAPF